MTTQIVRRGARRVVLLAACLAGLAACTHKPPTIAHTHIGHALTAFQGAPAEKSLFAVAEERAQEAADLGVAAGSATDLAAIKRHIAEAASKSGGENFGLKHALFESVNHLNFAATSGDATVNVQNSATAFETAANDVLNRCDLINLLASDAMATSALQEGKLLAEQIQLLSSTNLDGSATGETGVVQLRAMIDEMIANEDPPYETVDRWYLFHLVRLPNCENCWAWRKWANPSNRGY